MPNDQSKPIPDHLNQPVPKGAYNQKPVLTDQQQAELRSHTYIEPEKPAK
jgi:hypothetical protein